MLLLADVFEKIRNNNLKNSGLFPSNYLNALALMWDAMLNMAKVEFELISDLDMHIFFEKGMRGGVYYTSDRYSKAINKYLKSYNPKQQSSDIIFLDANNLHGYVMCKFLLTSDFKWLDPKKFDLNKYTSNSPKGYVTEVDFEYPIELWELDKEYPLAPDKIEIKN